MNELRFNPNITARQQQSSGHSRASLRQQHGLTDIHRLSWNENPLGPSPKVVQAVTDTAAQLADYPDTNDIELRQALVGVLGRGLTPAHLYTGCSGYEALELIGRGFLAPGDEVILSSPTFTRAYAKLAEQLGAKVVDVPLAPATFDYRVEAVLAAVTPKTRLLMLCNPNNPTGTILPADKMAALMTNLPPQVLVVADEVYHHFVSDPAFPDSIRYVLDGRNIIVVHSFSKAYGLAGLRLGYGIAKPPIADYLAGLHRGFHQNRLALAAGIAACRDQAHLHRAVAYLRAEAEWVSAQFDRLDIKYWKPAANFILFETKLPADELYEKMLARGIILNPQTRNKMPYGMRVSLGTRAANIVFITALEAILNGAG